MEILIKIFGTRKGEKTSTEIQVHTKKPEIATEVMGLTIECLCSVLADSLKIYAKEKNINLGKLYGHVRQILDDYVFDANSPDYKKNLANILEGGAQNKN